MGMTHGTIAGLLLPTLLDGREHPWAKEFDPKRITLHGRELGTLAKENADVALQFGDYVTPDQVDDVASIPAVEGRENLEHSRVAERAFAIGFGAIGFGLFRPRVF